MANGEMIRELQAYLRNNKRASIGTKLTLSALLGVMEKQEQDKDEIKAILHDLAGKLDRVTTNPFYQLGEIIRAHPQTSAIIGMFLLGILFIPHAGDVVAWAKAIADSVLGLKIP